MPDPCTYQSGQGLVAIAMPLEGPTAFDTSELCTD